MLWKRRNHQLTLIFSFSSSSKERKNDNIDADLAIKHMLKGNNLMANVCRNNY